MQVSEKVYFRSQILVHPSIGEYWNISGVPVLPENVIFTFFRTCWCYSEAYNTGTQKWSSIVQYSCTTVPGTWSILFPKFPHTMLLQLAKVLSSHLSIIVPAAVTTIRAKSVGPLRCNYQWFSPLPIFNVDSYRTGTDSTVERNIEAGVGRGNYIWIQELGLTIPSENRQKSILVL